MNGKLAVNIDEEALFELLVAANFGAPVGKSTVSVPAGFNESIAQAMPTFPWIADTVNARSASPSRLF